MDYIGEVNDKYHIAFCLDIKENKLYGPELFFVIPKKFEKCLFINTHGYWNLQFYTDYEITEDIYKELLKKNISEPIHNTFLKSLKYDNKKITINDVEFNLI